MRKQAKAEPEGTENPEATVGETPAIEMPAESETPPAGSETGPDESER